MYGNRGPSVPGDAPDISPETLTGSQELSKTEHARLEAATRDLRRAVDALVPDVATVDARVTGTPTGVNGVVVIQAPGIPPVGTAIEADAASLDETPALTETEVREKATALVAQATVLARRTDLDVAELPAN